MSENSIDFQSMKVIPGMLMEDIQPIPGWWGGAHPFALLDYSVVHNGEISS